MDPATICFGIIASIGVIVTGTHAIQEIRKNHRNKRAGRAYLTGTQSPPSKQQPNELIDAYQDFNCLIAFLGARFGQSVDVKLKADVEKLLPQLKALHMEIEKLDRDAAQAEITEEAAHDVEKRSRTLLGTANRLNRKMAASLRRFSKDMGLHFDTNGPAALPLAASDGGRSFCYGALLCQSGAADAQTLSLSSPPPPSRQGHVTAAVAGPDSGSGSGFICAYCQLAVEDYGAVRLSSRGEAMESSSLLAACHVVACASFDDRRAFYKCLACLQDGREVDFGSAVALERHMLRHPEYRFVVNEKDATRAMEQRVQNIVLDPPHTSPPPMSGSEGEDKKAETQTKAVCDPTFLKERDEEGRELRDLHYDVSSENSDADSSPEIPLPSPPELPERSVAAAAAPGWTTLPDETTRLRPIHASLPVELAAAAPPSPPSRRPPPPHQQPVEMPAPLPEMRPEDNAGNGVHPLASNPGYQKAVPPPVPKMLPPPVPRTDEGGSGVGSSLKAAWRRHGPTGAEGSRVERERR